MMKEHTIQNHNPADDELSSNNIQNPDHFENINDDDNNNDITIPFMDNTCLMDNLKTSFPILSNDRKQIQYIENIRTLIYKKISNDSYREHLILEKWLSLSSKEYCISSEDCDLFLRIVRQIILNSRDEQGKITDIYSRIEKRNIRETNKLYNHISKLTEIIESQKSFIQSLCNEFGISSCESLHSIPTLPPSENVSNDKDIYEIKKLRIPSSLKDARSITKKLLPGLDLSTSA